MGSKIHCRKCGFEIGRSYYIENVGFLEIGGALLREARGYCKNCGYKFYFSVSEQKMQAILEKWRLIGSKY